MKHTIAVIVNNRPGVLSRVSNLFSRRAFNIESLAVGTTEDENISRITIVAGSDESVLEQIIKQLYKLVDVIRVYDLPPAISVERELALIKVNVNQDTRSEIMQVVDIFRGRIVDVSETSMMIEIAGDEGKIEGIERLLKKFGIKELVRTGKISMARGLPESQ
jgi:acetolactate synthase-1/3 small subunit